MNFVEFVGMEYNNETFNKFWKTAVNKIGLNNLKDFMPYNTSIAKLDFLAACFKLSCYVDGLCKDGEISEKTYMNLYLHKNKKKQVILVCNSYRIKL